MSPTLLQHTSNSSLRSSTRSPSSEPISPCKPVSNYVASNFPSSLLCKVPRSVKANSIPLASALPADKIILLYFSAHWCGPCRQFTPRLVQFYNQYAAKYNFEVCFVSADHDEKSFLSYYEEVRLRVTTVAPSRARSNLIPTGDALEGCPL